MKTSRLIYGVGINDASYVLEVKKTIGFIDGKQKQKRIWACPYYIVWVNMLTRCYNEKHLVKNPTYKDCSVCDEWLTFSNFKAWMETQDWEGKQLDKDLLVRGNKLYSPEICVFVSSVVNLFITESDASRGQYPIGVKWDKNAKKFRAFCSNPFTGKQEALGYFSCPDESHKAWLKRKLELAKLLAKEQDDPRVAKALVDRYENYE